MNKFRKVIFFVFIVSFFLIPNLTVKASSEFKEITVKDTVNIDKQWVMSFNKDLDKKTVNKDNITIKDINNKLINAEIKLVDNKRISIKSIKNYEYGKKYTLIANKQIKSVDGKALGQPIKMNFSTKKQESKYTVCINAARGGNDSGSSGIAGLKEKDVNLDVAFKLGKLLEDQNIKVIYTRNSDKINWDIKSDIQERVKISNDSGADVLINIMCNSSESSSSKGIETYYLKNTSKSKELASMIQESLVETVKPINRGIKESEFNSLKLSKAPAVLVALGFITNKEEENLLKSKDYKDKLALALYKGVIDYLDIKENNLPSDNNDKPSNNNNSNNNNSSGNSNNGMTPNEKIYYKVINETIKEGEFFVLPYEIEINTENSTEKVEVSWTKNEVNVGKIGEQRFEGKIKSTDKDILLILNVVKDNVPTNNKYKVVLDPGHGGHDPGAIGVTGVKEKDVVLAISLKIGDILTQNGVDVVYTRNTDTFVSLQGRCDISNKEKPNCFVSIHANKFEKSSANGIETYSYKSGTAASKLAKTIQDQLIRDTGRADRGIKTAGFVVIKNTDAVAVLVETGFISNPQEEKILNSEEGQNKWAKSIATGILKNLGIANINTDN